MAWNWTFDDWPQFTFDGDALLALERAFLVSTGEVAGTMRHMDAQTREELRIEILIDEALTTSRIEGEVLDRASVQSSLCRQFGLAAHGQPGGLKERGIAEMTADVYRCFATALDDTTLFRWHRMMLADAPISKSSAAIARMCSPRGSYREHSSGLTSISRPPSARVPRKWLDS